MYDLNQETSFKACLAKLKNEDTHNFAVRFDNRQSHCAVDLDTDTIQNWLNGTSKPPSQTLWINVWASDYSDEAIKIIASKYKLSPRLTGLLRLSSTKSTTSKRSDATPESLATSDAYQARPTQSPAKQGAQNGDVEKAIPGGSKTVENQEVKNPAPGNDLRGISFASVVSDLWHFCSVDWGKHYLYVGFNALFSVPGDDQNDSSKPSGMRIWTSLLMCDDGTVVSIFERPQFPASSDLRHRASTVRIIRQNVLNIFSQLSNTLRHDDGQETLMKVHILSSEESSATSPDDNSTTLATTEWPSLVFYYLFDDWITTYALIARRQHPYRDKLESLRQEMSETADVKLIGSLHLVGRRLTVLNLMYQSYELIVSRILNRQRLMKNSNQSLANPWNGIMSEPMSSSQQGTEIPRHFTTDTMFHDYEASTSVRLSLSAIVRFERLLDRIRLYALTEIEECLKEKESLVFMTFNLVALKESQAVEKLTRTTILLAKATILFLPVSLMTAYFSIQLDEIQKLYSLKTYWFSFLVVGIISVVFLFAFGVTTNTVEGKTVYKSFTRILWDKSKRKRH